MFERTAVPSNAPGTKTGDRLSPESNEFLAALIAAVGKRGRAFAFAEGISLIARLHPDGDTTVVDVTGERGTFRGFVVNKATGEIVDVYLDNNLKVDLDSLLRRAAREAGPRPARSAGFSNATLPSLPVEFGPEELTILEIKRK
jgi:hypothetical protein